MEIKKLVNMFREIFLGMSVKLENLLFKKYIADDISVDCWVDRYLLSASINYFFFLICRAKVFSEKLIFFILMAEKNI